MSEYQYYEFLAIDRPLTADEMDELRELSTRATITPVSFTNEYNWGDFEGSPDELMERYFDAHVYDEACRILVDIAEAYDLFATKKQFQQELKKFMAGHLRRKALIQRLVKIGIWRSS
jgi:hypothetical protein